jgi:uncharacterized ion transporter superfamily protein YfcC
MIRCQCGDSITYRMMARWEFYEMFQQQQKKKKKEHKKKKLIAQIFSSFFILVIYLFIIQVNHD